MPLRFLVLLTFLALGVSGAFAGEAVVKKVVFAGGCFWCMQEPFDHASGVVKTVVGYTGGSKDDANYPAVSAHKTQHREAIEATTYQKLLDVFWRNINPTQADGQFADIGLSYQAAIYYASDEEKGAAAASKQALAKSGKFDKPIVTEILPAQPFYPAEEYHQKYYLKNPEHFEAYHTGSGRVDYIKRVWGAEK